MMGDYYDFEIKVIDGVEVSGFCYSNKNTGWNEVFVEMTEQQCAVANQIQEKYEAVRQEQQDIIKAWLKR